MIGHLRHYVSRYIREALQNPVLATSPGALEELRKVASQDFDGAFAALHAPVADYTWMTRGVLSPANDEASLDDFVFPNACEVVALIPTITSLAIAAPDVLPPLDALDVVLTVDRKDTFTARVTPNTSQAPSDVVNLSMLSVLTPRLLGLALRGPKPIITCKVRWAVPVAVRTFRNFGPVQVSIGFCVRDMRER